MNTRGAIHQTSCPGGWLLENTKILIRNMRNLMAGSWAAGKMEGQAMPITGIFHKPHESATERSAGLWPALNVLLCKAGYKPALRPKVC